MLKEGTPREGALEREDWHVGRSSSEWIRKRREGFIGIRQKGGKKRGRKGLRERGSVSRPAFLKSRFSYKVKRACSEKQKADSGKGGTELLDAPPEGSRARDVVIGKAADSKEARKPDLGLSLNGREEKKPSAKDKVKAAVSC